MIRLIGIDVDGTLVGSNGVVAPSLWRIAERVRAAGVRLALCSGRPAFGLTMEYARRLDVDGWHIFQNGASIVHLPTGHSRSVELPADAVQELTSQARRSGQVLELYSDRAYVAESTAAWARQHAELLGVPFNPRPFESLQGPPVRAQWLLARADALEVMAAAPAHLESAMSTSPIMPDTHFVGLTQTGISKGSAIRIVAAEYGIELGDVMYVGDSGNDLSALRIVGHPIAMGNADPAVLQAVKHSVGHVDEGGLGEALQMAIR